MVATGRSPLCDAFPRRITAARWTGDTDEELFAWAGQESCATLKEVSQLLGADPSTNEVHGREYECSGCQAWRPGREVGAVDAIAVVDQVTGVLTPGCGLAHLAPDPSYGSDEQ